MNISPRFRHEPAIPTRPVGTKRTTRIVQVILHWRLTLSLAAGGWSQLLDLNQGPAVYKTAALPLS